MTRALLLVAIVLALGAGSAQARPFGAYEEGLFRVALQHWGGVPTGCPYITKEAVPRWVPPLGSHAGTVVEGCHLLVAEGEYAADAPPFPGCALMLHEVGHLFGLGHSADPHSVMYPKAFSSYMQGADAPECLDPLSAIAAAPPLPLAAWPGEVEQLTGEEMALERLRERCERTDARKCWRKARHWRGSLRRSWSEAQARSLLEPVFL